MKTMEINELISELIGFGGESTVKVWSNGADKAFTISHVGQGYTDGVLDTHVSIVIDDDRNLVDLSKIWHDASEEPEYSCKQILYQDKYGDWFFALQHDIVVVLEINWEDFAAENISRWAYIDDLLPKGGAK